MGLFGGIFGGKGKKGGSRNSQRRSSMRKTKGPGRSGKAPAQPKKKPEPEVEAEEQQAEDVVEIGELLEEAAPRSKEPSNATTILPKKKKTSATEIPAATRQQASGDTSVSRRKRTSMTRKQLGNLLLQSNVISEQQLEKALAQQESDGGLLGQILVGLEACTPANVGTALNKQRTITTVELPGVLFDTDAIASMSREQCERLRCIPFQKIGTLLCVAMSNVLDSAAKNEIKETTQLKLKAFDASWQEIETTIQEQYAQAAEAFEGDAPGDDGGEDGIVEIDDDVEVLDLDVEEIDDIVIELPEGDLEVVEDLSLDEVEEVVDTSEAPIEDDVDVVDLGDDDVFEIAEENELVAEEPVAEAQEGEHQAVATKEVEGNLTAISVSEAYYSRVVREGRLCPEDRWQAERSTELVLPARPLEADQTPN